LHAQMDFFKIKSLLRYAPLSFTRRDL